MLWAKGKQRKPLLAAAEAELQVFASSDHSLWHVIVWHLVEVTYLLDRSGEVTWGQCWCRTGLVTAAVSGV